MEHKIKSYASLILYIFSGFMVLLILLSVFIKAPQAHSFETSGGNIKAYYGTPESYSAGCGSIYRVKPAVELSKVIPDEYYNDLPVDGYIPSPSTIVPMYGYMTERGMHPSQFKFYPKKSINKNIPESLIVRTMYDSNVPVVWYDADKIDDKSYKLLKQVGEENEGRIIIMPWVEYEGKKLPRERTIALSMFGMSQTCKTINLDTISQFLGFAMDNQYDGKPLEPSVADLTLPEMF